MRAVSAPAESLQAASSEAQAEHLLGFVPACQRLKERCSQDDFFRDIRARRTHAGGSVSPTGSPCSSAWPVNVRVSGAGIPLVLYSARTASFRAFMRLPSSVISRPAA